ncbi:unnamed protein product [Urochloa humidicola]
MPDAATGHYLREPTYADYKKGVSRPGASPPRAKPFPEPLPLCLPPPPPAIAAATTSHCRRLDPPPQAASARDHGVTEEEPVENYAGEYREPEPEEPYREPEIPEGFEDDHGVTEEEPVEDYAGEYREPEPEEPYREPEIPEGFEDEEDPDYIAEDLE